MPDQWDKARAAGCLCDACPLGPRGLKKKPVPPEIREGKPLFLAEAPGVNEEVEGRPFVGASGHELTRMLRPLGLSRYDFSISNACLCRPGAANNIRVYLLRLAKTNKKLKAAGKDEWPTPMECCRPRVLSEVAAAPSVLVLGATAYQSLAEGFKAKKLSAVRGFPLYVRVERDGDDARTVLATVPAPGTKPLLATYHPAFVLRRKRWGEVVRRDIGKFLQHAAGALSWAQPQRIFRPSPVVLATWMRRWLDDDVAVAIDVETDGKNPLEARLRCIGIGTPQTVLVVPFLSIDGRTRFYSDEDEDLIRDMLSEFGRRCRKVVGQNFQFDKSVLQEHGIEPPSKHHDTAILSHIGRFSELPHDLDFLSSFHTEAPKHKWGTKPDGYESDNELWVYCGDDVAVEAAIAGPLAREVERAEQAHIYTHDMRKQEIGRQMFLAGMGLDLAERERFRRHFEAEKARLRAEAAELSGRGDDFNIGSADQLRDYLFGDLGLEVPYLDDGREKKEILTESGDPSTKREAIEALLDRGLEAETAAFLEKVLDYKEAQGRLSNFIEAAEPGRDGRVRSTWSAHVIPAGRYASSGPNVANLPAELRSMYCAAPGNVLVYADKAQLHLRLTAALAGDEHMLRAFAAGQDVHKVNAVHLFKKPIDQITEEERQLTKTAIYAMQYGCTAKKLWQLLKGFYDAAGNRPHARIELRHVRWLYDNWFAEHLAIRAFHAYLVDTWKRQGWLASGILGRRRYFLDVETEDDKLEQIYNHLQLSTEADSVDLSMFEVVERCPWDRDRHTGLVHNGYDSLTIEVPEGEAEASAAMLRQAMTTEFAWRGTKVALTCDVKVGRSFVAQKVAEQRAKLAKTLDERAAWMRVAATALRDWKGA